MTVKEYIVDLFNNEKIEKISEKTLFKRLNLVKQSEKRELKTVLNQLCKEEVLFDSGGGVYCLFSKCGFIRGTIKTHEKGYAFFIPDDGSPDLFIPPRHKNGAFQGDTVLVKKTYYGGEKSDEAEVVKIIKRGVTKVSGVIVVEKGFARVYPDDKGFSHEVFIKHGKTLNAKTGDQVICEITGYKDDLPYGEIASVLGEPDDLNARIDSLLITQDIKTEFDKKTIQEAEKIKREYNGAEEDFNRTDFRDLLTVTIDGETAKDFDDAISVIKTQEGYELYVHIADVSHFVKPNGAIDKEAITRGTSIYFPGSVIPMLPEVLSNDLCSLKENEKRFTLSVKLTYDNQGVLLEKSFYKSIIKSNKRLTYTLVQSLFDGDDKIKEELNDYAEMLFNAKKLKDLLWEKREQNGSINLESEESEIKFENGELIVEKKQSLESESLIEEFMIAANVAVAEFLFYSELPAIYRVHEKPLEKKTESFLSFLNAAGIGKVKSLKYAKDYRAVLKKAKQNPCYPIINNVMLRSMQKAEYSAQNKGHFGLNEKCYCHFTSPIRRYPDLFVHRVLKAALSGQIGEIYDSYSSLAEPIALSSSKAERKAETIERTVDNIFIAKFMSGFIGDFFECICSGVTANGLYARLENGAEGFLPIERLPKGKYDFYPENYSLKSGNKSFKLGETLLVKLIACDIPAGKIYFDFVGKL